MAHRPVTVGGALLAVFAAVVIGTVVIIAQALARLAARLGAARRR